MALHRVVPYTTGDLTVVGTFSATGAGSIGDGGSNISAWSGTTGFQTMGGNARVWDDWNLPILAGKITGANFPNWASFISPTFQYQFAVNDTITVSAQEFTHAWAEGTPITPHLHWCSGAANNGTVRGVKWQLDYTWANINAAEGTIIFPAVTTIVVEDTIPANEAAFTHHLVNFPTITPTGGKIGAQLICQLTRVTAAGTSPATNPFALSLGLHFLADTLGSRTATSK